MIPNMLFHLDHYIKYIFKYFLNVSLKGVHIYFPNHILIHHINTLKNKNDMFISIDGAKTFDIIYIHL